MFQRALFGYDLILIGRSDHLGLWGRLLEDTADPVSDHARRRVLIVKHPGQQETRPAGTKI